MRKGSRAASVWPVFLLIGAAVAAASLRMGARTETQASLIAPGREGLASARAGASKARASRRSEGLRVPAAGSARAGAILDEDSDPDEFPELSARTLNWRNARGEIEFGALVGPYSNADASPVERLVALARTSVDVEIYEMDDPGFRRALRDALRRKVALRVIKEPNAVGETCDYWSDEADGKTPADQALCLDGQALRREIVAAGGRFERFNKNLCGQRPRPPATIGPRGGVRRPKTGRCFQHGKAVLIDKRLALISTGNFNASSLCDRAAHPRECNRDYTYVTRDSAAVASLVEVFERDLQGEWYDPRDVLRANRAQAKLTVSPWSLAPLRAFLASARSRIQIQNQYVYPESGLVEILLSKAKAGVSVEVQLADVCYYGKPEDNARTSQLRLMFQELESAGAKVRMFPKAQKVGGRPGKLHAKTIVIDGERAWLGSVNGSPTALNMNREFGVFFNHPGRVASLSRFMSADFAHPEAQTWQDSFDCRRGGSAINATE